MVWGSSVAVAVSLALTFSVHTAPGQTNLEFSVASLIALIVGFAGTWFFWKRLFTLTNQPKRMWRFVTISAFVLVAAFIGCIFLPQFAPIGRKSDLVEGMLLGFLAVAVMLFLARTVVRLFQSVDSPEDKE